MALGGEGAGEELAEVAEADDGDLEVGFGVEGGGGAGLEIEGLSGVQGADFGPEGEVAAVAAAIVAGGGLDLGEGRERARE